ncbi:E3 ubiquitin-protein ligase ATL4-like [Cynara cardunculus var. scolymus]|uniref:E3 ubiquitin-protein ligase ATL4-like n=1 Tax=Cynara cardunculus var. scolymus TaxID=59895 RepID=UPI000D62C8FD|nr:E3 ubiquitin-protein ligase ATL4-like [Cynara cardunculus var. scolymus]
MDIGTPPPPPPPPYIGATPTTTTTTNRPPVYNNGGIAADIPQIPHHHHHPSSHSSSSSASSLIIVMIVISSAIIVSATVYLLIRFLSRRCNRSLRTTFSPTDDVVSDNRDENENVHHHVISFGNNGVESLPLFRFSSLTGKIAGGDCAVCLSKFEGVDQLRLLPLCCHAFHAECIDAWLKSNQTCPLCRSTVNPTEDDVLNKIVSASAGGGRVGRNRSNSFRIEIGNVSQRREPSDSDRRSYSIGSYEYVLDDGYEISVESTHRRGGSDCTSVDKDSTAPEPPGHNLAAEVGAGGGSGRRNWLRDYVDRVSVSLSSRTQSLRGSGRFLTGNLRRSETVDEFEASHGRVGEEISELFRWLSGI